MGQVKKAYLDWCEKHDKNPNENDSQAMQDLEELQWRIEFEHWLFDNDYDSYGGEHDR
jgi:hypothetical protein